MTNLKEKAERDQEANKEHINKSGGWFKFLEGDNTFRILVEPEVMYEDYKNGICYTDCGYTGSPKYLTQILDRADGKIKLMKIPYSIYTTIAEYQTDEDYAFEDFPIPYDIKVKAVGAGTKEVSYTALPKKVRELSDEDEQKFKELLADEKYKTPAEIIEKMKSNHVEKHKEDGTWDKRQEDKAQLAKDLKGTQEDVPTIEYPEEELGEQVL